VPSSSARNQLPILPHIRDAMRRTEASQRTNRVGVYLGDPGLRDAPMHREIAPRFQAATPACTEGLI